MSDKPKSKGRVTYWAHRTKGSQTAERWLGIAFSEMKAKDLKVAIDDWNKRYPMDEPQELVRVEITPV